MTTRTRQGRTKVRLRVDRWDQVRKDMEKANDFAMAQLMGIDHSTISRLRDGTYGAGGHFIARALATLKIKHPDGSLQPIEYGDLFYEEEDAA